MNVSGEDQLPTSQSTAQLVNQRTQKEKKEAENRENWAGKLDFFLSALSFSVGLGAVWRFPYLCYKNGGGAFLIPFVIFLFLFGIPLMYMEFAVGQFTSRGPVMSWVMVPLFKGVGVSMNWINNYNTAYYIMIIAYSLYYLAVSLNTQLPWQKCNPQWSSVNCVDDFRPAVFNLTECESDRYEYLKCPDGICYLNESTSLKLLSCDSNRSELTRIGYWNPIFPSQDFWNKVVLKKSPNMDETGGLVWHLVLCLLISWIICFFSLFRGVHLSGKIGYFTALFPYLVLIILGIRGILLDGSWIGIEYYIKPDPKKLLEFGVWKDAAVQVFFTLSLSFGGLIALSSYNKFDHNILRDSFLLSITNFLTCLLAGFVVFAYLGALSKQINISIDKVIQGGQGLVYIVYPYAATTISGGPIWAVMFFAMMITLGMGSMMGSVETLSTSLEDFFPYLRKNATIKATNIGIICFLYFLAGLILCTNAGTYWVEFFDAYSSSYGIIIVALVECVSVGWFYGVDKFKFDVSSMVPADDKTYQIWHDRMFVWWGVCWRYLNPLILTILLVFSWIEAAPLVLDNYQFPEWSDVIGNILTCSSLIGLFGWMVYEIIRVVFVLKKPLKCLLEKDAAWRPLNDENNEKVVWIYENSAYLAGNENIDMLNF